MQTINATNTELLAVGTYNSYQTLYTGFTNSTNFTWTGATSNTLLNPFTFTVTAVSCHPTARAMLLDEGFMNKFVIKSQNLCLMPPS